MSVTAETRIFPLMEQYPELKNHVIAIDPRQMLRLIRFAGARERAEMTVAELGHKLGVHPTDLALRLSELAGREEGAERVPPEVGPDTSVSALLRRYPDAAAVLMKNGLSCVGCAAAGMETLASGALNHGIDLEQLLRDLEELL